MVGFTAAFANTILKIFKNIPQKYCGVFYEILDEAINNNDTLYYDWYHNDGPYGDLIKILKENGFEVKEDYEDCYCTGLTITW